jgi:hypothetical protein
MNEKTKNIQQVQKKPPPDLPSPVEGLDLLSEAGLFKEMDQFFKEYAPGRWWHQLCFGRPGRAGAHSMSPFEAPSCVGVIDRDDNSLIKAELQRVDKKASTSALPQQCPHH